LLVIVNRYLVGGLLRGLVERRERRVASIRPEVEVVIPLFNEGRTVYHTVESLLGQTYAPERLRITVVDDCSSDDSLQWAERARTLAPDRVKVLRSPTNRGKRRAINRAVRESSAEIIVSVDSDVVVAKDAIEILVSQFTEPRVAAVGGRVNVLNPNESWLTRMQTIKYHFSYFHLKGLERAFESVMCLSGALTAYRRSVLMELHPILENRSLAGIGITYGEDRFLTRQIVQAGYRTKLVLRAQCWTKVPTTLANYFSQQLRWRRSNLVDFLLGAWQVTSMHPLVALHYLSVYALLLVYPVIVVRNLASGTFWDIASFHLGVLAAFGGVYALETQEPRHMRVHPLWFMALGVLMPVTYLLFTGLALFTLDSGSWETRAHLRRRPARAPLRSKLRSPGSLHPIGPSSAGDLHVA
jgi:cellulose synthase/poly-beta-1,6-N-acetylglucosamine synthase-like glycosyltransferase